MNLSTAPASLSAAADLLAVLIPADSFDAALGALDEAFSGELAPLVRAAGFEAKNGQTFKTHTFGRLAARQVVLVGLGAKTFTHDQLRDLGGSLGRSAGESRAATLAVEAPLDHSTLGGNPVIALRLLAEGVQLGAYKFDRYMTDKPKGVPALEATTFLTNILEPAVPLKLAEAIVAGVVLARDCVNEPPNVCTPAWLAEQGRAIAARYGLQVNILDKAQLTAKGFNLHLAVGQGSVEEPCFIHLTYAPSGPIKRRVAFVGKGVTFDTGGYSLKPAGSMLGMHCDMGGAAAVLGAAESIGRLKPEGVEVHFIAPAATNRVSSNAYVVNEIIRGYGGKTVEIHNTDAEGRLLLADALAFAVNDLKVDEIIDLATLTGACVVALGDHYSAIFSNQDDLGARVQAAAKTAGERLWPLPLDEKLRDKLKSPVADMKNVGDRWGGAITAALFLKEWVGETPWVHLDIAGPAMVEAETPLSTRGGSGVGVALLVQHILDIAQS